MGFAVHFPPPPPINDLTRCDAVQKAPGNRGFLFLVVRYGPGQGIDIREYLGLRAVAGEVQGFLEGLRLFRSTDPGDNEHMPREKKADVEVPNDTLYCTVDDWRRPLSNSV